MYTACFIRRHIFRLPSGRLFTTRELLGYGTRVAVDQTISKLVRKGIIVRLARGVFTRQDSDLTNISAIDVARVKAQSFGKQIAAWGGQLARELGLPSDAEPEQIFSVNGSSSSFKFGKITIHFRKTAARKLRFGDSRSGQALRALWHLGRRQVNRAQIRLATDRWLRTDRDEARLIVCWLPAWLSSYFMHRRLCLASWTAHPH